MTGRGKECACGHIRREHSHPRDACARCDCDGYRPRVTRTDRERLEEAADAVVALMGCDPEAIQFSPGDNTLTLPVLHAEVLTIMARAWTDYTAEQPRHYTAKQQ